MSACSKDQDPVVGPGEVPIFGVDMWEHAYYLQVSSSGVLNARCTMIADAVVLLACSTSMARLPTFRTSGLSSTGRPPRSASSVPAAMRSRSSRLPSEGRARGYDGPRASRFAGFNRGDPTESLAIGSKDDPEMWPTQSDVDDVNDTRFLNTSKAFISSDSVRIFVRTIDIAVGLGGRHPDNTDYERIPTYLCHRELKHSSGCKCIHLV